LVAIIGTRGYPSFYGGFETAVRKLAPYLADCGWDVTVYGRAGSSRLDHADRDTRITTRTVPGFDSKSLSTLSHGLTSSLDATVRRPDAALVMNVANGYFLPFLRARGIPTLVNVDGVEWERAKWGRLGKRVFRKGAQLTAKWADGLVFDSTNIQSYWQEHFAVDGTFIPYGGDHLPSLPVPDGLTHRGYVLVVARFVPENSIPEFFEAVPSIAEHHPVVMVGSSGHGTEADDIARRLASDHPSVTWLGHVSDDPLLMSLWQHAGAYFHGHSVGGTNPALVQAMAAGVPIVARDTVFNREVLGKNGTFVDAAPSSIVDGLLSMMNDPANREDVGRAMSQRAAEHYSWIDVCKRYEHALRDLLPDRRQ
jgi:glycosyltransferase involved in cell wall biosynthesis